MSRAALDRLLAALVLAVLVSGVLTWRAGSADTWWLYAAHGLLSGVLLAASVLKLWRSLPRAMANRRWRQLAVAAPLAAATLLSLGIGFAWVAGGRYVEIGPWTLLGWHGIVAWAIPALVAVHLLMGGRWRLLKAAPIKMRGMRGMRGVSRRSFVAGGTLAIAGLLVWGVAELLDRLSETPRRFTGSRWLPAGGIPPPTTFFGEGVPRIDHAAWRLRVSGAVDSPLDLSLEELHALGAEDRPAVLDCTGGWALETTWHGVAMSKLLDAARVRPAASSVDVKSVTGWGALMSVAEARGTLLATGVAGTDLPAANGAPCRLVVPNRRGLDWVKWVSEVVVG
jgi:DMSO/TMAO reductase YedYZ molybdopterin-dependent catalytic subunit